ncbi:hypothetical protein F5Y18DRAFT_408384 [Xylariaceae sp. FL1019]|nr:hypothetical protein F5Y18DRAFT_408384 [Xylariaceae sp. FL1019]
MTNIVMVTSLEEHEEFRGMLKGAFLSDYGQHLGMLEKKPLEWKKKFAFTSTITYKRICFSMGDFVRVQERDEPDPTFAQVEGIFLYPRTTYKWLFVIVRFAAARTEFLTHDHLLGAKMLNLTDRKGVVGLSRILPYKSWIVPGSQSSHLVIDYSIWSM